MNDPLVKIDNAANALDLYPVLKGEGAWVFTLQPGESRDFTLEFNCLSKEESSTEIGLVVRPKYWYEMTVVMTKVCPAFGLLEALETDFEFDSFAFYFFLTILLTTCILIKQYRHLLIRSFMSGCQLSNGLQRVKKYLSKYFPSLFSWPDKDDYEGAEMSSDIKSDSKNDFFDSDVEISFKESAPLNSSSYGKL